MTRDEVQDVVRAQVANKRSKINGHGISLEQALVPPKKLQVIQRMVRNGRTQDELLDVWLIGREGPDDGYRIVMRDDQPVFGLASPGFPSDRHLVMVGWYGDLLAAFISM